MDELRYLVVDLETIPSSTLPEACLPKFDEASVLMGNLKDPFKQREKIQEARAKFETDLDKKLSTDPDLCQVCCFGYGDSNDQQAIIAQDEAEEFQMITEAWGLISKAYKNHVPIVTFNGQSFDLVILFRRAMLMDISVAPGMVDHLLARYNNRYHYDLMQMLGIRNPFSGQLQAKGLQYYLARFGLGSKTEGMDGSKVYPAFKEGRFSDIMNYCKEDVAMTAALFHRVSPWLISPTKREEK
jgi:uncharacterized protein YprB with RNaseH-like and TPR domain